MVKRILSIATSVIVLMLSPAANGQTATRQGFLPIHVTNASAPSSVVVERGDHLWKISATHLSDVLNRSPGNDEIAPYWSEVVKTNRDELRSGDPDLIYPGEVVILPDPASGSE